MMIFYLIISVMLLVLLVLNIYIRKKQQENWLYEKMVKVASITLCVLTFLTMFLPDRFVVSYTEAELKEMNVGFIAIIRWLHYTSFAIIPIAVFFDNKYFKKIAVYLLLPVALINLGLYFYYLPDFTSQVVSGLANIRYLPSSMKEFLINPIFRSVWFGTNCFIELFILLYLAFFKTNDLQFVSVKEGLLTILLAVILVVYMMPIYGPQYLFGPTNIIFKSWTLVHLLWILAMIAMIVILTIIFRKQTEQNKYVLLLMMALTLLIQYSQLFSSLEELTIERLPLQLCNIAAFLVLITLLLKSQKLFHFVAVINLVGALIAIILMDTTGEGILAVWSLHYMLPHTNVFIIPILCLSLKVFKPLDKSAYKDFFVFFTTYFVFVLIIGTVANYYQKITNSDYFYANYLFMFDKEAAVKLVPFVAGLFDIKLNLGNYTLYPVIQLGIYLIFVIVCSLLIFIVSHLGKEKALMIEEKAN